MKKLTIGKLQKLLWQECRRVADILYPPLNGQFHCYTCDKPISGSNKQLGHFLAKSVCGAFLKYDMRNLRWQCYHCNINAGGNSAVFYDKLVKENGQKYVNELLQDKLKIVKAYDIFQETYERYQKTNSI